MDLAEACDRVLVYSGSGTLDEIKTNDPDEILDLVYSRSVASVGRHDDPWTTTRSSKTSPSARSRDAVSDGLPGGGVDNGAADAAASPQPDGHRSPVDRQQYALLVVWGAMALFFYIALPSTFGRVATLQSIFGSQRCWSSSDRRPHHPLVGEFDLSIGLDHGMPPPPCRCWSPSTTGNVALACVVAIVRLLGLWRPQRFFVVKVGVSSLVVTLGTGTVLIGVPSHLLLEARSRFECGLLQTLALLDPWPADLPFITAWCWSPPSPT